MIKNLKIVHCANFSEFKNGEVFYSMDRKISYGLIQNGHFVYDFSYRDIAKAQRFLGFKKKSIDLMNENLITTCKNINPDLLVIGKSEMIYTETLNKIKQQFPNIKIIQWFVDFLASEHQSFFDKFKYIDAFFQTTATKIEELSKKYQHTLFSYLPNISDPSFDKQLPLKKEYDILYIARDHHEDVRTKFANLLQNFCKQQNLNLKIYGSLKNPTVFGNKYHEEISKSKIAINFNRDDKLDDYNKSKILGSSDRMNHFLGCGTCTFSPRIISMNKLYKDNKDIIYFDNVKDCFKKITYYLKDDRYEKIALSGQSNAYSISNAKRVTKFMLETVFENNLSENYEWKDYIFKFKKKT